MSLEIESIDELKTIPVVVKIEYVPWIMVVITQLLANCTVRSMSLKYPWIDDISICSKPLNKRIGTTLNRNIGVSKTPEIRK